jgi:putative transposase
MFVNFLDYKLKQNNGQLVEIGRFFPSSKTCSCCGHVLDELPLDIREWDCPSCRTHHDRDGNAALNIRNQGLRILQNNGEPLAVDGFPGISKVANPNGGGNPVIAVSRRSKTNKPQGGKASVNDAGSPHPICTQMGVG